jgi:hypothetical protein
VIDFNIQFAVYEFFVGWCLTSASVSTTASAETVPLNAICFGPPVAVPCSASDQRQQRARVAAQGACDQRMNLEAWR